MKMHLPDQPKQHVSKGNKSRSDPGKKHIIKINYLAARSNPNPKIARSICDQESAKSAVKMRGEVSGWFSEIVLMQGSPYS